MINKKIKIKLRFFHTESERCLSRDKRFSFLLFISNSILASQKRRVAKLRYGPYAERINMNLYIILNTNLLYFKLICFFI